MNENNETNINGTNVNGTNINGTNVSNDGLSQIPLNTSVNTIPQLSN